MVFTADDRTRLFRRQRAQQAIQLAMQGQWQEAAAVNRAIIAVFPNDVDAYNRLGKALTELGCYSEAREAYSRALELDPLNSIAQKNLTRLATLGEGAVGQAEGGKKLSPQMFISEMGKTGITVLMRPAIQAAARMTAGDEVFLRRYNNTLVVESSQGDYLGEIEPKLGHRLIKLMEGGNQYAAAIATLSADDVRVIIKETFQHPSQAGKPSFPPAAGEAFRPYTKEGLVRHDVEEEGEESFEEGEDAEDWDSGAKDVDVDVTLYEFTSSEEEEE
ncbi:MAG: tetratricopeptide repeat protein [Dehalococcoidia bacterium]